MRYKLYLTTTLIAAAALAVAALMHLGPWWLGGSVMAMMLSLCGLAVAVDKPLKAVQNGIYLLGEQDFASRLRPTGQADADRVIKLFNGMLDSLKAQRLRNLEQNSMMERLIAAVPSGVAICDLDGRIVQTNRAFDDLRCQRLIDTLEALPDDGTETLRLSEAQIYGCARLWFMDSGFRRRFYIMQPLTAKIVAAEKQVMHRIVRTIGHEVNNTLGSTISVLESLAQGVEAGSFEHSAIDSCRESCGRLVSFVQGYTSLVKLPAPQLQPVVLADELQRLMPQLRALASEGTEVCLEVQGEPATLMLDAHLMERVLINIVKNAAESIGTRGGLIHIGLAGSTLTVTDNGPGISAQAAAQLFTPFFSTKHPDRGLGLMLIAEILRGHGAAFSLATTVDTTFEIKFIHRFS